MPKTKKPHRSAGEKLEATTTLGREALGTLAQTVASEAHGSWLTGPGIVRFEKASAERLDFSVQTQSMKRELMTFALITKTQGGSTQLRTRIVTYKTLQQRFLLIPVGPKQLVGLRVYRDFMQRLSVGLQTDDPEAKVTISKA